VTHRLRPRDRGRVPRGRSAAQARPHLAPLEGAAAPTIVTYVLEEAFEWTRVTLRQERSSSPDACINAGIGWETSFERLAQRLAASA
jgi:hypothetical protein